MIVQKQNKIKIVEILKLIKFIQEIISQNNKNAIKRNKAFIKMLFKFKDQFRNTLIG